MVMTILANYKNNYDTATKTAQWALTPKQLNLVSSFVRKIVYRNIVKRHLVLKNVASNLI